ncbi:MAG: hypothetical protein EU547_03815 [Promethearchaeota archaeon]|nr:MAG: hypothetical protein EU547_03815 [Candidatus Lokiarchaeota archaeon]
MVKILDELWILTSEGMVLFNHVYKQKVPTQLFGALLSAINTFAEEVSDGGLSNFELSDRQFILYKKNKILFIGSSSRKLKKQIISEELDKISDLFFKKYPHIIKQDNWDGEISVFESFEKEIENAFEDSVKQFWKGF